MMDIKEIHDQCHQVGMEAGANCRPAAYMVGHAKSVTDNSIDYSRPTYMMDDGACGYAWITVRPGNSKLANQLKKAGLAKRSVYEGGVTIWVSEFGQSVERKEAYAYAYAQKLKELTGQTRIYVGSRLD